jgi:dihydroneopterin triphosphate diphosphatase
MVQALIRVVDVYPYRRRASRGFEYLLFRRAASASYEGQWRMIAGKIEPYETAWEAALRELNEETGCLPVRAWSVPSVNLFYEWQNDRVNIVPAFAAELVDDPALNAEHDQFSWLPLGEAIVKLNWPEQERLLRLVDRLLRTGIAPQLCLPI